jgi:uncharacterized membrane protein
MHTSVPSSVEKLTSDSDSAVASARLKRFAHLFLIFLLVYTVARGVMGAKGRPFWFDEFCTLAISGQPSLHDMWDAIRRGFDSSPPLFYLIERAALKVTSNKQIALRLPSILAFPCTLACVFVYARRRSGELIACLCALLLLSTSLFHYYLIEGRSYSMMIACVAFALLCYERYTDSRSTFWAVMLGLGLILAECLHYYALLAMIPFWIAEGVSLLRTRRFRWPIWLALIAGLSPLAIFWPMLSSYRAYYGRHIVFSTLAASGLPDFYGSYFLLDGSFGVALALVSFVAIAWSRFRYVRDRSPQTSKDDKTAPDLCLLSLIALPLIAFVLVRLTHAILTNRYVLAATIGIVLGAAFALSHARPKTLALAALFILSSVGIRELRFWHHSGVSPLGRELSAVSVDEFPQIEKFVQSGGHLDLPVVICQGLIYTQLAYYSPPSWTGRFVYLVDEQKEQSITGTDSIVKVLLSLRNFMPLRLAEYSEFTASHREFLLYSEGEEWVLTYLNREGASIQLLEMEAHGRLYLVKVNDGSRSDEHLVQ